MGDNGLCVLIKQGATLIDVREKKEFDTLHLAEAVNITLKDLITRPDVISELSFPLIVCSENGDSSLKAKQFLKESMNINVVDAGPWKNLCDNSSSTLDYLF
ncbi:rhodanese-like domain-containing protein [Flammeovirga pectinis]|uniref:Rhodanese-like domain-containing protein n=1 Tax=Flammeovirga pectinis TaxID=2494373 RepID=A0A3Q9FQL1_9BACT|nr:rhodanese-like domain-containing protein [Flammeovirga pectinis]AZQ65347.1 rhodanese-like domain-containing protein [Flammeovirga pectinis]